MELAAIQLAKAMAFVEPTDLNPRQAVPYPSIVQALVARYKFQKFPQKLEEFDEAKGVVFAGGQLGNSVVDSLTIFTYGIVVDTRSSTAESKRLLEEALEWARKDLGLVYKPSMIKRWHYASQVTFYSKVPLLEMHPALQQLAEALEQSAATHVGQDLKYDLTALVVDHDQLERKHPLGRFSIQRRENTPFSENKYFSDAPLETDVHLKLLEQFEAGIARR